MAVRKVNCKGPIQISAFNQAVIAGDFIYVSGVLGTKHEKTEIIDGGIEAQTTQILFHIETILSECGARLEDIVKITVYLKDMDTFHDMNSAYLDVIRFDPPARTTVGVYDLALGADVEMDCIAYHPTGTRK